MIKTLEDYNKQYNLSVSDPEKFWNDYSEQFIWRKKAKKIFDVDNARQVWHKIKEGDSIPKRFGDIERYVHNAMNAVNAE